MPRIENNTTMCNTSYKFIILAILSSLLFSCAYFNTYYNTKKYFKEALEENKKRTTDRPTATERQKFDQTISQASKVLQLYPNSKYVDDALLVLGESFYHIEEYRKAERKFQELIELFPNSEVIDDAQLWLAKTQLQLQRYDIAQTDLQVILQKTKNNRIKNQAQFWLAESFLSQENFVEASREFNKALTQIKDSELKIKTYQRLGECYSKLNSNHQAAESFHQAAKRSKNPDKQFNLNLQYAKALIAAEKPDKSVDLLNKLIAANDQHKQVSMAKLELANSYLAMKADEKAIELYNEIIEIHPRTTAAAGAYLALAQYDEKILQNYETAEKNYKQVKLQDGKSEFAQVANRRAADISQLNKLQKEIIGLRRFLQQQPSDNNEETVAKQRRKEFNDDIDATKNSSQHAKNNQRLSGEKEQQNKKANALKSTRLAEEIDELRKNKQKTDNSPTPQNSVELSQTQIDSINLLITGKKIELAELFLFRFEIPDSALFHYLDAISGSKSKEQRALAFYSIAEIFDDVLKRATLRDSVLKILANNYITTPQGKAASQKLGERPGTLQRDPLALAFESAQDLYLHQNKPKAAVKKLQNILTASPGKEMKIQTIYTLGWICENMLFDNKQAMSYYSQILQEYPDTEYAKKVKKKVNFVKQEKLKQKMQEVTPASGKQATKPKTGASQNQTKSNAKVKNAVLSDSTKSATPIDSLKQAQKKKI
ncbi:MAG: tetratricopeptide repeat protein [bacterium]